MAISRSQLVKELEPGLNALFGLEYSRYENQHAEIFSTETSDTSSANANILVRINNHFYRSGTGIA